MKTLFYAAATAAAIAVSGSAVADELRGFVTNIDDAQQNITVNHENVFKLGTGITTDQLKVGDRVLVDWQTYQGGYKLARKVEKNPPIFISTDGVRSDIKGKAIAKEVKTNDYSNVFRGVIVGVNKARQNITLSTGDVFKLGTGIFANELRIGDYALVTSDRWAQGYRLAQRVELLYKVARPQPGKPFPAMTYRDGNLAAGKVTALDFANNLVTLNNSGTFKLGTGLYASELEVGDKVEIRWNTWGQGYRRVNEMEVLEQ